MGAVIAFPASRVALVNDRTPRADRVSVAPHGVAWAAWLHFPSGRTVALEYGATRDHALADAQRYCRRVGVPLYIRDRPLDAEPGNPRLRGRIYIWSGPGGLGGWHVEHESEHGDSSALLVTSFDLNEARALAREAARARGASFDDPGPTFGGAA
ncbi:hypothetical protein Q8W71_27280 [Methylobacterium sp. NEAU 140]|uniref:hypothetical protein n=1 Tax=Methylobacterium sp. NEAU 140 TaxID=3064945 RepID=UPI002735C1BC|nr:hypothetical protein [Methylobacterium sp. NEAU 140]MDP4026331.1 hypothetical protein [Methylobacterium sp. NEAU 140]